MTIALLAVLAVPAAANGVLRVANPTPNAGPEKNPLKGFNSGWWNVNQEFASVGYQTLDWGQLEPSDDDFQFGYDNNGNKRYVEDVLTRPGSQGRHVVVQLNVDWCCYDTLEDNYNGPDWLKDDVGVGTIVGHNFNDPTQPLRQATDYNDPRFISEAAEAVAALTNYLRDDPRTFVVQTGVLGWWGEWHTFGLDDGQPGQVAKETILEAYVNGIGPEGFNGTTPGGLNGQGPSGQGIGPDGLTQVRFPDDPVNVPQQGVGYVNGFIIPSTHGYEFGEEIGHHEFWRNGPVGGEVPPLDQISVEEVERFFETEEGAYLLAQGGYTHLLVPEDHKLEAKLGEWTRTEHFEAMHRLVGYSFQVEEVRHLDQRATTGGISLEIDLQNVGIAPFYKDWDVELAVLDDAGVLVELADINFDLRSLMPGDSTTLAADLGDSLDPNGNFQLALRIVQPGATSAKDPQWLHAWQELDAENVYVVVSNDVNVVGGSWDGDQVLRGGWNVLDTTANASSAAVPEPAATVLMLTAGVILTAMRR